MVLRTWRDIRQKRIGVLRPAQRSLRMTKEESFTEEACVILSIAWSESLG
jgi:hypothetical protein